VGIGTDGLSSNHNLDVLEELRFLYLISSMVLNKSTPYACVYLATLGGARALFLEDKIGSIEEGKEADLVFLTPKWRTSDPYMSVISSRKEDVALVMCRGKVLHSRIGKIF
jgi:5-methylthioadenosine/S-adenosylhomocysteine deaminase